jgi:hypothetical protein
VDSTSMRVTPCWPQPAWLHSVTQCVRVVAYLLSGLFAMTTRNAPRWATLSIARVSDSGTGAVVHLFAGAPLALTITVAIVVSITGCAAAIGAACAPYAAGILDAWSRACVRRAVMRGRITVDQATALLGDKATAVPDPKRGKGLASPGSERSATQKTERRADRRRKGPQGSQ